MLTDKNTGKNGPCDSDSKVDVRCITPENPLIDSVLHLGKRYSKTLGFMPEGAFLEYSRKQCLLGAINQNGQLAGYLLYRMTDREAAIAHLCTSEAFRGKGIGTLLVNRLKEIAKEKPGIGLWCRREYKAAKLWQRLGFVSIAEKTGRGKDGGILEKWWYDHGHPDLFNCAVRNLHETAVPVVLDACVFIAMHDSTDTHHEQAQALLNDWLSDVLDYRVTDEIYNDIRRDENQKRRGQHQSLVTGFLLPATNSSDLIFDDLQKSCPTKSSEQDLSDIKHLAKAISYGAPYFVTLDLGYKDIPKHLLEKYNIRILDPTELIVHLDELVREAEYSPKRAAETYKLSWRRVKAEELDTLWNVFHGNKTGERKSAFKDRVISLNNTPSTQKLSILEDINAGAIGLLGYEMLPDKKMEVRILRTRDNRFSSTIIRFLLSEIIHESILLESQIITVTETCLAGPIKTAAAEMGFIITAENPIKLVIPGMCPVTQCIDQLSKMDSQSSVIQKPIQFIVDALKSANDKKDYTALSRLEHYLYPWKAEDANIPTFIIPIKPYWAHHLFDKGLAQQDFLGVREELALNRESVYYKSPRNTGGLTTPARILWYVSSDGSYIGKKSIRACSRLLEVCVDDAKQVFRRFQRLGVYTWEDIHHTIDKHGDCLALRFDDTELFQHPMEYETIKQIFPKYNCTSNFTSPRRITHECFVDIYKYCANKG